MQSYKRNSHPNPSERQELEEKAGLSARFVRIWFQNKRCKDKKQAQILQEYIEKHTRQE
jgi:insulin gene enhancer protein ISL-1